MKAAKQRQRAHGSAAPVGTPRKPKRDDRVLDRIRDVARRPKKYFLAKRLQESELTPTALAEPQPRRRRTVAVGRAPAIKPEVRATEGPTRRSARRAA